MSTKDPSARNVYAFGLTSLFNDTATEMAYWIVPAFLVSIGAGPAKLGVIEGIAESVASFTKLIAGRLADRVPRRKPLVVGGYVVANAAKPFLAIASSWWHVLIVRFADRLSKGLRSAPRDVMLAESLPQQKLGSGFGFQQAMDSAGAMLGPALAIFLVPHIGFRGVFWMAAVPGLLAVLTITFGVKERRNSASEFRVPSSARKPLESNLETRNAKRETPRLPGSFYYLLAAATLFSLGNSSDMFLILRAQTVGISPAHAPLLGLVFNATYTVASWPFGRLSDRYPKRIVAAAGYGVFAITYFTFARAPSAGLIWGAMAFYGLFYALSDPVLRAQVAQTVHPDIRGHAFGVFYFVISIAVLLSSIVTGELWKHFGPRLPFYISATLATIAAVMLLARSAKSGASS